MIAAIHPYLSTVVQNGVEDGVGDGEGGGETIYQIKDVPDVP